MADSSGKHPAAAVEAEERGLTLMLALNSSSACAARRRRSASALMGIRGQRVTHKLSMQHAGR